MRDDELVASILARDRRSIAIFYRRYTPGLIRHIQTKVESQQDAEEILQDTLFAFLEGVRDFHGNASITRFLYSICNHKIVDYYRKKKIKQIVFSKMPQLETLVSPLLVPEEEFDVTVRKEKITSVLSRLLPHYRNVLMLKYLDNLPVAEIARKLAVSLKSAESMLSRARKSFVEAFIAT